MRLKEPAEVAVIFDTSILIGIIFEQEGRETGRAKETFESFKKRENHKLFVSEAIFKESVGRLFREANSRGLEYIRRVMDLLEPLLGEGKAGKLEGAKLKVAKIAFTIPDQIKHDEEIIKAAIVAKEGHMLTYLVHKNPKDFSKVKLQLQTQYNVLTIEPPEYIDP